jgi:DNA (cytosine-5)-methyltransferase 1
VSKPSTRGATRPAGGRVAGRLARRTVNVCAGPGGIEMGARILGLDPMIGVELDDDACATGRAAGFERQQHDMRLLSPKRHRGVTGAVITPPCPGFSAGGKGLGRRDMQTILDAITCMGTGCGCEWTDLEHRTADPRSQLVVECARWVLLAPSLTWFLCEQVPAVAPVWEDITAEAYAAGWEHVNVIELSATDFGLPSKRVRTFVYGRRYDTTRVSEHDAGLYGADLPRRTMAGVLGLPAGTRVVTRGDRKTSGGNAFSADRPSWCLTGSTRSWKIVTPDGASRELTAGEAGLLNGFPTNYPWRGSRTKQFLQVADVVNPVIAAVALGIATNTPWVAPVRAYLEQLYGPGPAAGPTRRDQVALAAAAVTR